MPRFFAALLGLSLLAGPIQADNTGPVTEIDGLKSKVPGTWKPQAVTGQMRAFHFIIPKAGDDPYDAEMIVFFFGRNGGGGVKANLERWKGTITPPADKKIDDVAKVEELKVGDVKATMLDATGAYLLKTRPMDPSDKGEKRDNYRFIGVVLETPNGPYFIRLVGPAKTIEANKKGFDAWLKGLK